MSEQTSSVNVTPLTLGHNETRVTGASVTSEGLAALFGFVDMVLIAAAAYAAKILYFDVVTGWAPSELPYLAAGLVCAGLWGKISRSSGNAFSSDIAVRPFRPVRLLLGLAATFAALVAIAYAFKIAEDFSRGWLGAWFFAAYLSLVINRALHQQIKRYFIKKGVLARTVFVLGAGERAGELANALDAVPGLHVIDVATGVNDPKFQQLCDGRFGTVSRLDEVIIDTSDLDSATVSSLLNDLSGLPAQVRLYSENVSRNLQFSGVSRFGMMQFINTRRNPIGYWGRVLKGSFDFLVSLIMLLLLAPLFAVIAAAIKLDSRGPVFFRQRRHGLNHRVISVFKFRTMTVMEDGGVIKQAVRGDQRVTMVGGFLRSTSLDELPQLLNVLRGEMSLVGPRPHALAHNEEYAKVLRHANYSSRHFVKPGITGWAQINGHRGPTATPEQMQDRVLHDLEYIDNWSIWFDLEILLLTGVYGFMGKNAV